MTYAEVLLHLGIDIAPKAPKEEVPQMEVEDDVYRFTIDYAPTMNS